MLLEKIGRTYTINGLQVPSVTEIIGTIRNAKYPPGNHAGRGTAIHELTELVDKIPDIQIPSDLLAPIENYNRMLAEIKTRPGFTRVFVEQVVGHERHYYAGTADRIFDLGNEFLVVDLKSGQPALWHHVQAALYAEAWEEMTSVKTDYEIWYLDQNTKNVLTPRFDCRGILSVFNYKNQGYL